MYCRSSKERILKKSGYLTLEILLAVTGFVLLNIFFYTPTNLLQQKIYSMQVQAAAQRLGADIRAFQQNSLFGSLSNGQLVFLATKDGYYIESADAKQKKYVYFNKIGCENVYISQQSYGTIRFSNGGAPLNAGTYKLSHYKAPYRSYTITIQVASGRVDINET